MTFSGFSLRHLSASDNPRREYFSQIISAKSKLHDPSMMEAKLLYLEFTDGRWNTVNDPGVPISQAQASQAPPSLFTADSQKRELIEYLTAKLTDSFSYGAEIGWSRWFVGIFTGKMVLLLISS